MNRKNVIAGLSKSPDRFIPEFYPIVGGSDYSDGFHDKIVAFSQRIRKPLADRFSSASCRGGFSILQAWRTFLCFQNRSRPREVPESHLASENSLPKFSRGCSKPQLKIWSLVASEKFHPADPSFTPVDWQDFLELSTLRLELGLIIADTWKSISDLVWCLNLSN